MSVGGLPIRMSTDIVSTVESWPGIVVEPHRFGGRDRDYRSQPEIQ
jgi:hypothetical protein